MSENTAQASLDLNLDGAVALGAGDDGNAAPDTGDADGSTPVMPGF